MEATKNDRTKPNFTLIPPDAELQVAKAFDVGARKYGEDNWRGLDRKRLVAAAMRHINAWRRGIRYDESTYHSLAHAAASLMMVIQLEEERVRHGSRVPAPSHENNAKAQHDGDSPHGQVEARGPGFELLGEEP